MSVSQCVSGVDVALRYLFVQRHTTLIYKYIKGWSKTNFKFEIKKGRALFGWVLWLHNQLTRVEGNEGIKA